MFVWAAVAKVPTIELPVIVPLELILPEAVTLPVNVAVPVWVPSHSPVTPVIPEPSPAKAFAVIVPLALKAPEAVILPVKMCVAVVASPKVEFPLVNNDPETLTVPEVPAKGVILFTFKLLMLHLVYYKYRLFYFDYKLFILIIAASAPALIV